MKAYLAYTKNLLTPAVLNGQILADYYVCNAGNVYSSKGTKLRRLKPAWNQQYPTVAISQFGIVKKIAMHRIVCETLVPFTKPKSLTKEQWKDLPEKFKTDHKLLHFVNHKDHNKKNFHPSNLEWVTPKGNADAYQSFVRNR